MIDSPDADLHRRQYTEGEDRLLRSQLAAIQGFEALSNPSIRLRKVTEEEAMKALERAPHVDLRHIFEEIYEPKHIPGDVWQEIHRLSRSPFAQDIIRADRLRELVLMMTPRGDVAEIDPRTILWGNFNGNWKDFLHQRRALSTKLALMTAFNTYPAGIYDVCKDQPPRFLQIAGGNAPVYLCENGNNRVQAALATGQSVYGQVFRPKYLDVPKVFGGDAKYQQAMAISAQLKPIPYSPPV